MEGLSDKLAEVENRIEEKEKVIQQEQPKMTEEQALAVLKKAEDTEAMLKIKLSQKANELIEHDDAVGEKFTNIAKDTVNRQIETFDTKNKLQGKKNYYELNEKDVLSLGGDKSSTKGQQFSIVMIKRFFWILFMATLGTFFIAPMSVIIELFQGISFKNIEKVEYENKDGKKTEWVIKKHKLGKAGTIVGWIVGFAVWGLEVYLIWSFPTVFLILASVVFVTLLVINLCFGIRAEFFKKIFKRNKEEEVNENTTTIEIEPDED